MKTKHSKWFSMLLILVLGVGLAATSISQAASISARVRILEAKVYHNSKEIRKIKRSQQAQEVKLKRGLKDLEDFKEQVVQMIAESQKKKKHKHDDWPYKEYAYP